MKGHISTMDDATRKAVWNIAARVEWSEDDWRDFYEGLTLIFTRIAVRAAKAAKRSLSTPAKDASK